MPAGGWYLVAEKAFVREIAVAYCNQMSTSSESHVNLHIRMRVGHENSILHFGLFVILQTIEGYLIDGIEHPGLVTGADNGPVQNRASTASLSSSEASRWSSNWLFQRRLNDSYCWGLTAQNVAPFSFWR